MVKSIVNLFHMNRPHINDKKDILFDHEKIDLLKTHGIEVFGKQLIQKHLYEKLIAKL